MFGYKIQKKDFYSQVRFYKVKVDTEDYRERRKATLENLANSSTTS